MKIAEIYRILDANYNRSKEATRVIEDIFRFLMKDPVLTKQLKECRHRITQILLRFPVKYATLVKARDSHADVGKNHSISDQPKVSVQDTLVMNFKRAQESMRVLEELTRMISRTHSDQFRKVRFHLYELEKKAVRKF